MKKQSKRTPRPIYKPMLVINHTIGAKLESANYAALSAFQYGVADESHFMHFNDMANMLLIAGSIRKQDAILAEFIENDVAPILTDIKNRFERIGKLGLGGGDIDVLRDFIKIYNAYWKQESSGFLIECQAQMNRYYAEIEQRKAA